MDPEATMSLTRLLLYKIKIFLANFTRGRARQRSVRIITAVILLALFVGLAFGAFAIFRAVDLLGEDGFFIASFVVLMAFNALLLVAFVFDILATTNIFFLSSDLHLLIAAPLSTSKIFCTKYLEALGSGSFIAVLFGIPVLIGFGAAFDAPALFFAAIVPVFILFLSVPVSIGTLCGLLISRFVAPSKVKEVLGVVGGMLGLGIWLLMQVVRRQVAGSEQVAGLSQTIKIAASYTDHFILKLLPSHLAADGVISLASGDLGASALPLAGLAAIAGVMFAVSVVLAERMYLTGWSRVAPGKGKGRQRRRRKRVINVLSWLPSVERAILTATARLFLRDPQQITPVATITVMMAVLPFVMGRSSSGPLITPGLILRSFTALTFIGALYLSISTTGIDGRSFWMVLTAPCSAIRKLASKLMVSVIFFVASAAAIALAFAGVGMAEWGMVPKLIWLAVCMSCAGGSIGILLGIHYTDWEWEIPKRMLKVTGRLIMLGIIALFFVIVAGAVSTSGSIRNALLSEPASWKILAGVAIAAASITAVLLLISARKLERMEWTI